MTNNIDLDRQVGTGELIEQCYFRFSIGEYCVHTLEVDFCKKEIKVLYRQYDSNELNKDLLDLDQNAYLELLTGDGDSCVIFNFKDVAIKKHLLKLDYSSTEHILHNVCFSYEDLEILGK